MDSRLGALVFKLRHPLAKIRSRALHSLLFKLRERLVRWQELEPLQNSLIPALLACLEPPLELETLHVLQLLVQSQSEVFLASLQHSGAAEKLQRAANCNPELQSSYEKLLRQIYVTKLISVEIADQAQVSTSEEEKQEQKEQFRASAALSDRQRAPKVPELEAQGWKFAPVTLTSVDEQVLFEFEVKLQLRTETQDIVKALATFRNDLLRNFPAEVFLQRPAALQYMLHLVQQPILPGSPATSGESGGADALERAMEVSFGVNYFDEMLTPTFSNKLGNLSGAVAMASLKAIESFLFALKITRMMCLDPTFVVHAPKVHVELFDSYDTRRVLYPRASVEVENDTGKVPPQRGGQAAGELEQFSLSGAIYKIFMSTLPLLRSARHPRLHLLNLLVTALPDLPEIGSVSPVQDQDKLRLKRILEFLGGICRSVTLEQAGNTIMDSDLEFTHSTSWKLVELVVRLLRLYPSSRYHVEGSSYQADSNEGRIIIPRQLWEAVKLWAANPLFSGVAAEWKDEALARGLSKIDASIDAFVNLKRSSQQDARLVLDFVAFAKAHRDQLVDFSPWEKPSILNLEVALKTIQTRSAFGDTDAEIIADATLQTICTTLTANSEGELAKADVEAIQVILGDLLSGLGEETPSTILHFFRGLMALIDHLTNETYGVPNDRQCQIFTEILCEPRFLTLLLLVLARQSERADDQVNDTAFWGIFHAALRHLGSCGDRLLLLEPVLPLLQHFAYIEPSEASSIEQRSTQPQLAEILNRVETIVSVQTRHILICRCLLHESTYIRKAAASGILRLLSQVAPSCVEWISRDKEILEDPFGGSITDGDGKKNNLERMLMETPLPVNQINEYEPSENELSSQLRKLSHLYKVISGASSTFGSMRETALKELVMFVDNASVQLFTLFEELDKFADFVDLLRTILKAESSQNDSPTVQQALLLFRTLLLRSRLLRSAIRRDRDVMELLMPLIFHSSASVRAQMYYIVLLLTCSAENFIPHGAPVEPFSNDKPGFSEARIPDMIKTTFGLHSSRWARCFVATCSLVQQFQASCALLSKHKDSSWLQEVRAVLNQTKEEVRNEEKGEQLVSLLGSEYAVITQKLRAAPSHGKCLNAVYHLMTICEAWRSARERFVEEWEADFERYFAVPPKSERDEVIISSLVNTLSMLFCAMTRGEQLRALVVVKRKVLPLLKRSQSKAFSLQVARLLLNVSDSKIADLFVSLAADTDILSTICAKYSSIYATDPVLQCLMLEVLLRFARGLENPQFSASSGEKIRKRLVEMLSPLLTVVCRHRVPGSFLERDVFVVGSQCMIAILRTLPREILLASDSPLEHTDSSLLLDGSWASRLLFDHVSPIRELGFRVMQQPTSSDSPSTRLLEMAFETSIDDTEADAVRAAACSVLTEEVLRFHERLPDQQAAIVEVFHGTSLAGKAIRSLLAALKSNKLLVRTTGAFVRLVRALYVQRNTLKTHFGDMKQELEAAEEEDDIYARLVQALSLREWKDSCNHYSSCCLLLPCDGFAWRHSLLPAILELTAEVLTLLQAVCHDGGSDQVAFFLLHTTLQYQLMELVQDVHNSFDDTLSTALKRRQCEVLDLCASTLSILLVQACDQHSGYDAERFGAPTTLGFGAEFMDVVASLLEPQHPIGFRVSFSRVVPAVSLLIPGSLQTSKASVLCSAVFDLYQEVAEFRPLEANRTPEGRVFPLASIQRVSSALRVLVEANPSLQQLVQIKRAVPFAMASIKESFAAIRVAGGFGGKRTRSAAPDSFVLDLCGRIQTHMEVVSSIIGNDNDSQRLAKDEGLLNLMLSNWNIMKAAHVRGSQLMLRALHLLTNYCYGNDQARSSMLIYPPSGSGGDNQTLLSLVFDLASNRGEVAASHRAPSAVSSSADMTLSNAACQVLKSVLLNSECVLASVKTGSISRLIDSLQDRLKQVRQTSKTNLQENENLANMLSVLSGVASSEEGACVLYSWATVLVLVLGDVLCLPDETIRRSGCLFLRNLALSQATKNHFALWEQLLDEMVALCVRVTENTITLGYLSAALWSLVYDNQKARALLLSRPTALRSLQQVLRAHKAGTYFFTNDFG
ncbi:hypothetical protein V7S43_008888 [Phytophthora oleae]|uniref:HEAT repeat-containing protein 1 n=1 Tax=Phytophthora oleae TaxID=2107226 RepID=A0ABD3FJN6_9STRA